MKYVDNRERSGYRTDTGNAIHAFIYTKLGSSDPMHYEETEYGISTDKGFTLAFTEGELEQMIKLIKQLEKAPS